jgi:hypothetical protein
LADSLRFRSHPELAASALSLATPKHNSSRLLESEPAATRIDKTATEWIVGKHADGNPPNRCFWLLPESVTTAFHRAAFASEPYTKSAIQAVHGPVIQAEHGTGYRSGMAIEAAKPAARYNRLRNRISKQSLIANKLFPAGKAFAGLSPCNFLMET